MRSRAVGLLGALTTLAGCSPGVPGTEAGATRHELCGLTFSLPPSVAVWSEPAADDDDARCRILASPHAESWPAPEDRPLLEILVYDAAPGDAALLAGFARRDSGWVVLGRHGVEYEADSIAAPGWWALRGIAEIGGFSGGTYSGLMAEPRALVFGPGGVSVLIRSTPDAEDHLDAVLATLALPGSAVPVRAPERLTLPLTASTPRLSRSIDADLVLEIRREGDRLGTVGWDVAVHAVGSTAGSNLLYHSREWHGPHPSQVYAWSEAAGTFGSGLRELPVHGHPWVILLRCHRCATHGEGPRARFTGGELVIEWRRVRD